ncbi:type II toxin-antitoxin system HicA family toxin [Phormidium sp. LEGE 05292]|uniref:type II toxin-antitoxin system HicA family toxin n=1 Tax=[Phormidium] sp. LEGE 05292 TaxID=767427 RepID=UPI00188035C0|nr:type II toxin-antitoxin system HicA family toxin [Phormidium sp. LEGE 05292]MBE9224434.1 type II toxin-antitoxin system HicA family toxin [Phormidium sp. LEGE 05292]
MKLPRDLSGEELVKVLARLGYEVSHQTGSHIRLTTQQNGEHHVTVPAHDPIKVGTLKAILRDIATHAGITREELLAQLFS